MGDDDFTPSEVSKEVVVEMEVKTPPFKPSEPQHFTSPISTLKVFLDANKDQDLTPSRKRKLEVLVEGVASLSDTPNRRIKSQKTTHFLSTFDGNAPESVARHESLSRMLSCKGWDWDTLLSIQRISDSVTYPAVKENVSFFPKSKEVLNIQHIHEGEGLEGTSLRKGKGLHTYSTNPKYKIENEIQNPNTGVIAASWRFAQVPEHVNTLKFSIFFPVTIDTKLKLKLFLEKLETQAEAGNRRLLKDPQSNIWAEACLRKVRDPVNRSLEIRWIYTAFPLFFVDTYEENRTFTIHEDFSMTSEQILNCAKGLIQECVNESMFAKVTGNKAPIRYFIGDNLILIDLASAFAEKRSYLPEEVRVKSKIDLNLCFLFDRSIFQDINGFNELIEDVQYDFK